jgi:hypothetical protein
MNGREIGIDPVGDVIREWPQLDDQSAKDIRCVLEDRHFDFEDAKMGIDNPFDADAHYSEKRPDDA